LTVGRGLRSGHPCLLAISLCSFLRCHRRIFRVARSDPVMLVLSDSQSRKPARKNSGRYCCRLSSTNICSSSAVMSPNQKVVRSTEGTEGVSRSQEPPPWFCQRLKREFIGRRPTFYNFDWLKRLTALQRVLLTSCNPLPYNVMVSFFSSPQTP
jgi:hypothetical protein